MGRAAEAFQVLKLFLKPTLWALVWMTGLRILLWAFVYFHWVGLQGDLPWAFWAGFRFDLLVLGFFWIPIVTLTWFSALFLTPQKIFRFVKAYFFFVLLGTAVLSWFDFFWTSMKGTRLNAGFLKADWLEVLSRGWEQLGPRSALSISALVFSSTAFLLFLIARIDWLKPRGTSTLTQLAWQVLGSLFLVASAARGTWTAHHLNIEHALVSENPQVNQLPLNAVWNLDH